MVPCTPSQLSNRLFHLISDCAPLLATAWTHICTAPAQSSIRHYTASFRLWLAFLINYKVQINQVDYKHFMAFIQMLINARLSPRTIQGHISAIKYTSAKFNLPTSFLSHNLVHHLIKSIPQLPSNPLTIKQLFTPSLLQQLLLKQNSFPHPLLYKALYLLAFHGFFRISNLVPNSLQTFNLSQHLARGDIIFGHPGAHIVVKWTKTINNRQGRVIQLSSIPNSPLCPILALQSYIAAYPASPNQPFFSFTQQPLTVCTQNLARRALALTISSMALNPRQYTFHTFRHSGATLAFQLGVPLEHIQAHGTWKSDAIWSYLGSATTSVVPDAISSHLSS